MSRPGKKYLDQKQIDALYDALDAKLSQRKVAEQLGCTVSTVNFWKQKRDRGEYDAPDDADDDEYDPNRVLSWHSVEDRCGAAWRLCRQTRSVDERMELLSAAIWPQEAPHFEQQYDLIDSVLPDENPYDDRRTDLYEEI